MRFRRVAPIGSCAGGLFPHPGAPFGSRRARPCSPLRRGRLRDGGFTLVELLVVVALVALASAMVSLAVRDPQATQLEREGARLAAVLESARAESRASGVAVWWVPGVPTSEAAAMPGQPSGAPAGPAAGGDISDFRWVGLPAALALPGRWLAPGTQAVVVGAPALVLGPEPLIGPQRVQLQRGPQRLVLATDGLSPFAVVDGGLEGGP